MTDEGINIKFPDYSLYDIRMDANRLQQDIKKLLAGFLEKYHGTTLIIHIDGLSVKAGVLI